MKLMIDFSFLVLYYLTVLVVSPPIYCLYQFIVVLYLVRYRSDNYYIRKVHKKNYKKKVGTANVRNRWVYRK